MRTEYRVNDDSNHLFRKYIQLWYVDLHPDLNYAALSRGEFIFRDISDIFPSLITSDYNDRDIDMARYNNDKIMIISLFIRTNFMIARGYEK